MQTKLCLPNFLSEHFVDYHLVYLEIILLFIKSMVLNVMQTFKYKQYLNNTDI